MTMLVGQAASNFTASAVLADGAITDTFSLSDTIKGKGDKGMKDTSEGMANYFKERANDL